MKKIHLLFIILISFSVNGQILRPAKWTFKLVEKEDGEAELVFKVKLDNDWHIYSQYTPDGGPLPMLFTFDPTNCYTLIDKVTEPKPIEQYDSLFEIKVYYLEKEAILKQKVRIKGNNCTIKGKIEYQACKDVCIALDTAFIFNIGKGKSENTPEQNERSIEGFLPDNNSIHNAKNVIYKTKDSSEIMQF